MRETGALRSCCRKTEKKGCDSSSLRSVPEDRWGGGGEKKLLLVHLLHSRSLLPPLSLLTHSHKLPPLFSPSSRETQAFYLQKQHPHHLIPPPPPPPLPWSHTRTHRSPSCPRFVYFTPLHNARINFSKPI